MNSFPSSERLDDMECLEWLEQHLHPNGLVCPHCQSTNRRVFRTTQAFTAYRCRSCDGYYTILTGTLFEKTRQRPATVVHLLRGIARGETTAHLARTLEMSYTQVLTLRHRLNEHPDEAALVGLVQEHPAAEPEAEPEVMYESAVGEA